MKDRVVKHLGLTVSLAVFVAAVMMSAMLIAGSLVMGLHFAGAMPVWQEARPEHIMMWQELRPERAPVWNEARLVRVNAFAPLRIIFPVLGLSTLLGIAIAVFFSKKVLKPIRGIINATNRVADGDFDVRVDLKGVYELEKLSSSFNKMTHELSAIETLRSDFINTISHEFKTPIVSIRGFAKLLKNDTLSEEEKREYIDVIIVESERLSTLSTNILDLSKYENLEIIADKTEYRLDEQIRQAIVLTEPKWAGKDLDVSVEMEEVLFTGNADLMQQIWLNLIDNAIKFSYPGGNITVRLKLQGSDIVFTIKDDGQGMDEKTQALIFDKFYQGNPSRAIEGNGLGLAIAKRIADLNGGYIEVKSNPGLGSEFTVNLPRA